MSGDDVAFATLHQNQFADTTETSVTVHQLVGAIYFSPSGSDESAVIIYQSAHFGRRW